MSVKTAALWFFTHGTHRSYHGNTRRNAFSPFTLATFLGVVTTITIWGLKCI